MLRLSSFATSGLSKASICFQLTTVPFFHTENNESTPTDQVNFQVNKGIKRFTRLRSGNCATAEISRRRVYLDLSGWRKSPLPGALSFSFRSAASPSHGSAAVNTDRQSSIVSLSLGNSKSGTFSGSQSSSQGGSGSGKGGRDTSSTSGPTQSATNAGVSSSSTGGSGAGTASGSTIWRKRISASKVAAKKRGFHSLGRTGRRLAAPGAAAEKIKKLLLQQQRPERKKGGSLPNTTSTNSPGGRKFPVNGSGSAGKQQVASGDTPKPRAPSSTTVARRTDILSLSRSLDAVLANKSPRLRRRRRRAPKASRPTKHVEKKKFSVCVLSSSYKGTDSETADLDNYVCTPAHYIKKENRHKYRFTNVEVEKTDAYRTLRELASSQKYDLFFNLCDGSRDEKRAGVEVVSALEDLNVPFTGTDSRRFEPNKVDMKLLVQSSGVRVPNYAVLRKVEGLAKRCCHLRFPVIVKHITGYASVGISKDSLCQNIEQLRTRVTSFIARFNHALVEEFIVGREGTVLATADPSSPCGVKVFRPLMFNFLSGPHDFAYFDKKWKVEMDSNSHSFLPPSDPAYAGITNMARNAFHFILNGVGYGRVDFRIDEKTGEPVFLEINPNCGMWYSSKDGGDYADLMVEADSHWTHERFFLTAAKQAIKQQAVRKPWYLVSQDKTGTFTARATRNVPANYCLFGDMQDPVPVIGRSLYKLGGGEEEDNTVGCVIMRGDGRPHVSVALRHSCEPNLQFIHGRTLLCATKRPISTGEELSIDYATIRDEQMPRFTCTCGTKNCRSIIFSTPSTPRTIEMKAIKKLLREKKQQWIREKSDSEAEKMLKRRSRANTVQSTQSNSNSALGGVGNEVASNTNPQS